MLVIRRGELHLEPVKDIVVEDPASLNVYPCLFQTDEGVLMIMFFMIVIILVVVVLIVVVVVFIFVIFILMTVFMRMARQTIIRRLMAN